MAWMNSGCQGPSGHINPAQPPNNRSRTNKYSNPLEAMNLQAKKHPLQIHQMQVLQMQKRISDLKVGLLRKSVTTWLAGMVITAFSLLQPLPAMAMALPHAPSSKAVATMPTVAAMPNKAKAVAKDTEGKLESAYGGLTGDVGRQIKGNAKQAQSSAMSAGEDLKEGAKSAAKKVGSATD